MITAAIPVMAKLAAQKGVTKEIEGFVKARQKRKTYATILEDLKARVAVQLSGCT